jgi:hypothetical protein
MTTQEKRILAPPVANGHVPDKLVSCRNAHCHQLQLVEQAKHIDVLKTAGIPRI